MHIYAIINTRNGKCYVGLDSAPTEIHRRWAEHRKAHDKQHQYDKPLYRAMRKYGVSAFEYRVLEECQSREQLMRREQHWIAHLGATVKENGYNMTLGGDMSCYEFLPEGTKQRISADAAAAMRARWKNLSEAQKDVAMEQVLSAGRKANAARAKEWLVTSPAGERQCIKSLRAFCLKHDLQPALMHLVANGKQTHHKGWTCSPSNGLVKVTTKFARRSKWILQDPSGLEHIVLSLKNFCLDNGLIYKQMHKVTKGIRISHRGWKMKDTNDALQQDCNPD